jgi:Ca2+-binding RTX toxin-like protein
MSGRKVAGLSVFAVAAVLFVGAGSALTAGNTVPATHAGSVTRGIAANDLKPAACAGITLTDLVTGSGTFSGTNGNDLIVGGPGNDTINGKAGDDCILGGGGNDSINGGGGNDVCIGGPGIDSFAGCSTAIQ